MHKKELIFFGRPDGLGNRFEELLSLSNFAVDNNILVKYYWNNSGKWNYLPRFKAKNISIEEVSNLKRWPTKNFESSRYWREYISTRDLYPSENIFLDIKLPKSFGEYIVIHLRGTDRIVANNKKAKYGFQSESFLYETLEKVKKYLDEIQNILPLKIISEDLKLVEFAENYLSEYKKIELPNLYGIESAYQDFAYMLKSKKIILSSKFSTFALSAGLLGNVKMIKFHQYDEPLLNRWKNNFENSFPNDQNQDKTTQNSHIKLKFQEIILGNNFIQSFKVPKKIVMGTKFLIVNGKSNYFGFEENFKIINNKVKIKKNNYSFFQVYCNKIISIVLEEKNRKQKILHELKNLGKSLKILGFSNFFFKFNLKNNYKKPFFLFSDYQSFNEFMKKSYVNNNLIGVIVTLEKNNNIEIGFEKILNQFSNLFYINHINAKPLEYIILSKKSFFEIEK